METHPVVPSLEKMAQGKIARLWRRGAGQVFGVLDDVDRGLLQHALNIFQLASVSARSALLPTAAQVITVVLKDLKVELQTLVGSGRVGAARALLAASSEGAELRWNKVLEPPSTSSRPKTGGSDFKGNAEWLRRNRSSFAGMWVALAAGQLVDHDKSRLALHRRLEAAGKLVKGTLFTKVN